VATNEEKIILGDVFVETNVRTNPEARVVKPTMIIIHTNGDSSYRPSVKATDGSMQRQGYGCQFGVGYNDYYGSGDQSVQISQYTPLTPDGTIANGCSSGREDALNIEIAGTPNNVEEAFIPPTAELVVDMMIQYGLPFSSVYGHNEQSEAGKPDPGEEFLATFRQEVYMELMRRGRADLYDPHNFDFVFNPDGVGG
jgi:hypothetical protein